MSFTIFITEFIIGNSNENVMSSSTVFSMIVAFQALRWLPGGQRVLDLMKHYAMSNDDNYENQGSKTLQFCQAIDNGDHYTDQLMTVNPNHLYKGQLLLILRSTHPPLHSADRPRHRPRHVAHTQGRDMEGSVAIICIYNKE